MADPAFVDCPKDVWTKVATNATQGLIHIINIGPNFYLQTYRDTGGAAPTLRADGVPMEEKEVISAAAGIDVYVYPLAVAGRVRVDLA